MRIHATNRDRNTDRNTTVIRHRAKDDTCNPDAQVVFTGDLMSGYGFGAFMVAFGAHPVSEGARGRVATLVWWRPACPG